MMQAITLDIPEELADQLRPVEQELPRILELGLREFHAASQPGFAGSAEVLEFLASLPSPEEILALRPSPTLSRWIEEMLEKNRNEGLTPLEQQKWEQYQYLEHLVRMAKIKAYTKLNP
jgi:hypothetical protein